jgi:hypothetical protein
MMAASTGAAIAERDKQSTFQAIASFEAAHRHKAKRYCADGGRKNEAFNNDLSEIGESNVD